MLLITLAAISVALVSSQANRAKSPNPCFSNQQGTMYPIAGQCSSYIYCQEGMPLEYQCPIGQGFSAAARGCVQMDVQKCDIITTTTVTTAAATIATTASDAPNPACLGNEQKAENKAACIGMPMGEMVPYPGDCAKYLVCNECVYPKVKECSGGLWFNMLRQNCDEPANVSCRWATATTKTTATTHKSTSSTTPTTDTSTESTVRPTSTSSTVNTNEPPSFGTSTLNPSSSTVFPPNICSKQPNGRLFPYEPNCANYIYCRNDEAMLESCPRGYLFDAYLLVCSKAEETNCVNEATTPLTTLPPLGVQCAGKPKGHTYPYESDCSHYLYCNGVSDVPQLLACPKKNWYNPATGACGPEVSSTACIITTTTTSTTTSRPTTPPTPQEICKNQSSGASLPLPGSCERYVMCLGNNNGVVVNCPRGNYYNPDTGNCGPQPTVGCGQGTTNTVTSTSTTASFTSPTPTTPLTPHPVCNAASNGEIVPIPNDCRKYVQCVSPAPVAFNCPGNSIFNPLTLECENNSIGSCIFQPNATTSTPPIINACHGVAVNDTAPYPGNCQFYIRCFESTSMLESCNMGQYYDAAKGQCSADASADACSRVTTVSTTGTVGTTLLPTAPTSPSSSSSSSSTVGTSTDTTTSTLMPTTTTQSTDPTQTSSTSSKTTETTTQATTSGSTSDTTSSSSSIATSPSHSSSSESTSSTTAITSSTPTPTAPSSSSSSETTLSSTIHPTAPSPTSSSESTSSTTAITSSTPTPTTPSSSSSSETTLSSTIYPTASSPTSSSESTSSSTETTSSTPSSSSTSDTTSSSTIHPTAPSHSSSSESTSSTIETTSTTPTPTTPSSSSSSETTSTSVATTRTTTTASPQELCKNKQPGATVPLPGTCDRYLMCLSSTNVVILNCPSNNYYDPVTEACGPNVSSDACLGGTTTSTQTTSTTTDKRTFSSIQLITTSPRSTTVDPPNCQGVPDGTAFADKSNCKQYYVCAGGSPVITLCMPNNYYDPVLQICTTQATPTECQGQTTSTTTTTTETTTTSTTVTKPISTPTITTASSTSDETTSFPTANTSPSTDSTSSTSTATSSTSTQSQIINPCSFSPDGTTEPYPGASCSAYILCWNHGTIFVHCPSNHFYAYQTGHCSAAVSSTDCEQATTITTPPLPTGSTAYPPITSTQSTRPTTSPTTLCSFQPDGTELSDPNDCTKYILCEAGKETYQPCPSGMFYDPKAGECSKITSSTACKGLHATTSSTGVTTAATTLTITTTATETTTPITKPITETVTMSSVTMPTSLQTSSSAVTSSRSTSSTSTTSSITTTTTLPSTTDTSSSVTSSRSTFSTLATSTSTPQLTNPCFYSPDGTTEPYPGGSCSTYILCWNHATVFVHCPIGNFYDFETGRCSSAVSSIACQQATSITTPQTPSEPTKYPTTQSTGSTTAAPTTLCSFQPDGTVLSDPDNCTQYIQCEEGKEVAVQCAAGNYYNPQIGKCDTITSATACKGLPVATTSTSTSTQTPTTATTTTETTTLTTNTPPNSLCAGQPDGTTLFYPADCTRYIYCEHGLAKYRSCATGSYYNPTSGNCDEKTPPTTCQMSTTTTAVATVTSTTDCPSGNFYDGQLGECTTKDNNNNNGNTTTLDPPSSSTSSPSSTNDSKTSTTQDPPPPPTLITTLDPTLKTTQDPPIDPPSQQPITPTDSSATVVYPPNNPTTKCQGKISGTQVVYIGDCTKYNFCFANGGMVLTCQNNWYYNPNRRMCVPPYTYRCPW